MEQRRVCLTIGGSDSCGGAGIQADLRVFEALGARGCSAITALTAQNPQNITRIEAVPLAQLDAELHAVFDYYNVASVKTGMLLDSEHIATVSAALSLLHDGKPLVVDPVMVSSSGVELLDKGGRQAMLQSLLPMTTLLTPNLDEAAVFLGRDVENPEKDSQLLMQQLGCAVLLKGGHREGDELCDVLCEKNGKITSFSHPRLDWNEQVAHGSGCRLAAAITTHLARGNDLPESVGQAIAFCTMSTDQPAFQEYTKVFHIRFKLIEMEYNTPYHWPEIDTLRYEICGCISFGLNQAAITLTNHLLESLLKYSLAYSYSIENSKQQETECELVELMMEFTDKGLKKYGKATLNANINEAQKVGLINDEECSLLHSFRNKFRNPFGHSDKEGTFGDFGIPVSGAKLHGSELLSRPPVEVQVARMPILHGLAQAQIAEIEAPKYFKIMDAFVRKMKERVFK